MNMGIDIYAHWRGQTEAEKQAQYTGFSTVAGRLGYLREAYHGEPYATRYLCPEAFEAGGAKISAKLLRERLPETLELVAEREREIYQSSEDEVRQAKRSFSDFVDLCEGKEEETGEPVEIVASY